MTDKNAAVQVEAKPESKMSRARTLLAEIRAVDAPEGSSHRKEFIRRAQEEIGLTQSGTITYYNNLNNEAKGLPLYKHTRKAAKAEPKAEAVAAGDEGADEAPEDQSEEE